VDAEAAVRLRVAPARKQVTPVLDHEPEPDPAQDGDGVGVADEPGGQRDRQKREHPETERHLVDTNTEDVHPRPERVLIDPDQRGDSPPTGPVGQA
jgi:hypothetical protein